MFFDKNIKYQEIQEQIFNMLQNKVARRIQELKNSFDFKFILKQASTLFFHSISLQTALTK